MSADEPAGPLTTWREQAVARSLDSARQRAEKRVQRFLDASLELMNDAPDKDFTVQEVVERSGQSLRSFYQHFAGKQALLMALFEESVRWTANDLRRSLAGVDDPLDRLHHLTIEYHARCRPGRERRGSKALTPVLAEFAQHLLTVQPADASRAFAPLVALFDEVIADAAAAGRVRRDRAVTALLLQAIMFNSFAKTISGTGGRAADDDLAEELWDLILNGIGRLR